VITANPLLSIAARSDKRRKEGGKRKKKKEEEGISNFATPL